MKISHRGPTKTDYSVEKLSWSTRLHYFEFFFVHSSFLQRLKGLKCFAIMLHGSWEHRSFSSEKPSERFKYADEVQLFMLKIITPCASEPLSSTATYDNMTSFFAFRVFKQSAAVGLTPTVCFDLKWRVGGGRVQRRQFLRQSLGRATRGCQRTGSPIWRRWHCKCDIPSCNINLRVNRTHNWLLNTSETLCWRQ